MRNDDYTRMALPAAFAWGLYVCVIEGDELRGDHVGAVETQEEAQRWINGDDTVEMVSIYNDKSPNGYKDTNETE